MSSNLTCGIFLVCKEFKLLNLKNGNDRKSIFIINVMMRRHQLIYVKRDSSPEMILLDLILKDVSGN